MTRQMPPGWEHAPSATCGDVGEHALIRWIASAVGNAPSPDVLQGIGDDAAVVRPRRNHVDVLTTDVLVDGVHFTRALSTARDVGHRALHVNLSDIAAMGAEPRVALLSLGLPVDLAALWVAELVQGLLDAARLARVHVIGGNISHSPTLFVDVTVSGSIKPRQILRRSGARAGDELYVSGEVGAAAAGLAWLQRGSDRSFDGKDHSFAGKDRSFAGRDRSPSGPSPSDADAHVGAGTGDGRLAQPALPTSMEPAIARYRRPEARVALGMQVARNRAASACMDTSDGLADALRQLAGASGVGVRVDAATLPVSPAVTDVVAATGCAASTLVWSGGEDYELLFAVPRRSRRRFLHATGRKGLPVVTRIGVCTKDADLVIVSEDQHLTPLPGGYEHFVSSAGDPAHDGTTPPDARGGRGTPEDHG
jgi:thiamine-monophosphate kinase